MQYPCPAYAGLFVANYSTVASVSQLIHINLTPDVIMYFAWAH